jgi:hypothetical protein
VKTPPSNSSDADLSRSRQLIHIDLRAFNAKRVREIAAKSGGLIQILSASDRDCPACTALDGKIFKPVQVPVIPPEVCSCLPHFTCVMTVISKDQQFL